jgi:hypothetical protein
MGLSLRESVAKAVKLPAKMEVLVQRAALLCQRDRVLIEATMGRGETAASVATLTGEDAVSVRRRVVRLCRHLTSRRYLDAARAIPYLSPSDALLARLHWCAMLSGRELSERIGVGHHALRRRLDGLHAQISALKRMRYRGLLAEHACRKTDPADTADLWLQRLAAVPA